MLYPYILSTIQGTGCGPRRYLGSISLFEGGNKKGMQVPHVIYVALLHHDTDLGLPGPQLPSCPDVSCPAVLLCSFALFLPHLPHAHRQHERIPIVCEFITEEVMLCL